MRKLYNQPFTLSNKAFIQSLVIFVLGAFIFLFFLRFYNLSADPPNWKRVGDVFDEGLWTINPRSAVLWGTWFPDQQNTSLGSPLFSFFLYISFKLFGVSFFSARVVSAVFGCLTLFLSYWILLKSYGKRMAIIGLGVLGFNATYLMYNRLALVETMIAFFVLLSFFLWYLGRKDKLYYFLAGVAFSCVCLAKIFNVIYVVPIAVIWILEYLQDFKMKKIAGVLLPPVLAMIGFLVVTVPFYYSHYLPNIDAYTPIYEVFRWHAIHFENIKDVLHIIALGISQAFAEHIFTQAPMSLLLVLLIPFALYFVSNRSNNILVSFQSMHPLMMYCVIFTFVGWFVSMPFGFIDRRQVIFIIPFACFVTRIIHWSLFETKEKPEEEGDYSLSRLAIIFGIFSYALWSFCHVLWRKYEVIVPPFSSKFIGFAVLALIVGSIFLILLLWAIRFRHFHKILVRWTSLLSVILLCLLPLTRTFLIWKKVLMGMGIFANEPSMTDFYIWLSWIVLAIVIIAFFNKRFTVKSLISKPAVVIYIGIYILVCGFEIFLSVGIPTKTMYKESVSLGKMIPSGAIVKGTFSHSLAFENQIYPFFPHTKGKNETIEDRDAGYYIIIKDLKDEVKRRKLVNDQLEYVKTIKVLPYLFSQDNYRVILDIYIDREKLHHNIQNLSRK